MRHAKLTPKKQQHFLDMLREGNTVTFACKCLNLTRVSVYELRRDDAVFAAQWDEAYEAGGEVMEQEAFRRAVQGVNKPIVHLGIVTDTVKDYSDTLLIFLLKGRFPDKYADRTKADQNVHGETQIRVVYEDRGSDAP